MHFGISSVPKVFQHRMHEVIEGLEGVEVVADDFVVVGFGSTEETAGKNHDIHKGNFLKRCEERHLQLNDENFQLRQTKVPSIGHVVTSEGLQVDPYKVKAIVNHLLTINFGVGDYLVYETIVYQTALLQVCFLHDPAHCIGLIALKPVNTTRGPQ